MQLNVYFPQWQGSGDTDEILQGAKLLNNRLKNINVILTELPNFNEQPSETNFKIKNYAAILNNLVCYKLLIESKEPKSIFTLGGDCSIEIAPISYLSSIYSDLHVYWFDAHGDINSSETSPSGTFHGMPVRAVLGGVPGINFNEDFKSIKAEDLTYIGVRDLDLPEEEYINSEGIRIVDVKLINDNPEQFVASLNTKAPIYIHFDLDVIDPTAIAGVKCPVPQGLCFTKTLKLLEKIKKKCNVVGSSVVEFTGESDSEIKKVISLIKILAKFN